MPASLIKEWVWCPTFAWFATFGFREPLPPHAAEPEVWDPVTVAEELLTYRRAVRGVGYEVIVKPRLRSRTLGIRGVADLVMISEDMSEGVVAEVKTTSPWALKEHVALQLTAYAVMVKESYGVVGVKAYAVTKCWFREVDWRSNMPKLVRVVRALRRMLVTEEVPEPAGDGVRCVACPYRRVCPHARLK